MVQAALCLQELIPFLLPLLMSCREWRFLADNSSSDLIALISRGFSRMEERGNGADGQRASTLPPSSPPATLTKRCEGTVQ